MQTSTVAKIVNRLTPRLHIDPVMKLPPEITSKIFSYVDPCTLITASLASRSWRDRIFDPTLWRNLYGMEGWRADIGLIRLAEEESSVLPDLNSKSRNEDSDGMEPKLKKRMSQSNRGPADIDCASAAGHLEQPNDEGNSYMRDEAEIKTSPHSVRKRRILSPGASRNNEESTFQTSLNSPLMIRMPNGRCKTNWQHLYRQRRRLEENWTNGRFTNFQLPHPTHPEEAHKECIYSIQFSGKWLVSASRDRTIRVWNLETKRLRYPPLEGHEKSVLCVQFDASPTEDIIVSGSSDRSVFIWKFSTGELLHRIRSAHKDSVLNLKFDHRYIVTCSKDKLIKVWNRKALTISDADYPRVYNGSGVTYPPYIVDVDNMPAPILEAKLASGSIPTIKPYSCLMVIDDHAAAVNAIQINDKDIVSASGDRLIKIFNIRDGSCKKTLIGHEKGIACVQSDNRRILSGSNDNTVRIYDNISGAEVACLRGHRNLVRTVQAAFGDSPGSADRMRMEASAVDNNFLDAKRLGIDAVDLSPSKLRRLGHDQDTTGSSNPLDIQALGAKLPPGGGGTRWGRIVSGSYDETVIIWKKDRRGRWVISHRLELADASANATKSQPRVLISHEINQSRPHYVPPPIHQQNQHQHHHHQQQNYPILGFNRPILLANPQRTTRVFKLQFDARKIICASQDHKIVAWDFACNDDHLIEACRFFGTL